MANAPSLSLFSTRQRPFSAYLYGEQTAPLPFGGSAGLFSTGRQQPMTARVSQGIGSLFGDPFLALAKQHSLFSGYYAQQNADKQARWQLSQQQQASQANGAASGGFNAAANADVGRWSSEIGAAATKLGVPPDLIAAIIEHESAGQPEVMSSVGATGLMQIMPAWKETYGGTYGYDLTDPTTNILYGAAILRHNYDMAKERYAGLSDDKLWDAAVAAYLGDWNWAAGTYAGVSDAYGTNGPAYVASIHELRKKYQALPTAGNAPNADGSYSLWGVFGGNNYTITQGYGATDFSQSSGMYPGNNNEHMGVDVGVPSGTALYSPFDGEVVTAGDMGGYGTAVYIKTTWGYLLLGHMSQVSVRPGQHITAGTQVGLSGNTGASTGAHTHVETRDLNGNHFDPSRVFAW